MSLGEKIQMLGAFLMGGGMLCIPLGARTAHPVWGDNIFVIASSLGGLLWVGVGLILVGSITLFLGSRVNGGD
jgi:hypothetical protein